MKLNLLFGTLIGYTISFLLIGLWTGELRWSLWIAIMIGGAVGHFIMVNVKGRNKDKRL